VPQVDITFTAAPGLTDAEAGDFYAKTEALEQHATAILAGQARISALMTGKLNGTVLFDPAPAVELQNRLERLVTTDLTPLGADPECIPEAIPAIKEGGSHVVKAGTDSSAILNAGQTFETLFGK
jgi:hypothetical protein